MKLAKILAVSAAAAAIILCLVIFREQPCFEGGKNYVFYCGTSSKDCKVVNASGNLAAEKLYLKNVCGESAEYESFDLESFLSTVNGKVVFVEELSDSVNYYCTADLPYSVDLYGKEINLHVCVRGDRAKVGTPIIFGGY